MPLIRALSVTSLSATARARLTAVRELIEAGSAEDLATLLFAESDALTRETVLTQLARLDGAFPAQVLIRLMRGGDTALRNAAIETLAALGERATDALAACLKDGDVDARIHALTALQLIASARAAELALRLALEDEDANVCAAAIEVVAESGVRDMAAALDVVAVRFPDHAYLAFAARAAQRQLG